MATKRPVSGAGSKGTRKAKGTVNKVGCLTKEDGAKILAVYKLSPALRDLYGMHAAVVEKRQALKAELEKLAKRGSSLYDRFWLQAKTEIGVFDDNFQYDCEANELLTIEPNASVMKKAEGGCGHSECQD